MTHAGNTKTENEIVRKVKVDRDLDPMEALGKRADGKSLVDTYVVISIPKGEGEEVEVVFLKLDLSASGSKISLDDLEKEFEARGLKFDPRAVIAANEADQTFADTHPNITYWRDHNKDWNYVYFGANGAEDRYVMCSYVRPEDSKDTNDSHWFGGVRK